MYGVATEAQRSAEQRRRRRRRRRRRLCSECCIHIRARFAPIDRDTAGGPEEGGYTQRRAAYGHCGTAFGRRKPGMRQRHGPRTKWATAAGTPPPPVRPPDRVWYRSRDGVDCLPGRTGRGRAATAWPRCRGARQSVAGARPCRFRSAAPRASVQEEAGRHAHDENNQLVDSSRSASERACRCGLVP